MNEQLLNYIRTQQPKVNDGWESWFRSELPLADPNDSTLVHFIWKTILNSTTDRGQNLSTTHLDKYFPRDGDKKQFVIKLCKVFDEPVPPFKVGHYARTLSIPKYRARKLLKEWCSFIIKDAAPEGKQYADHQQKKVLSKLSMLNPLKDVIQYLKSVNHSFEYSEAIKIAEDELEQAFEIDPESAATSKARVRLAMLYCTSRSNPVWRISGYRIFSLFWSLQNAYSEHRRIITPYDRGYIEIDLKSCHPAIFAGRFDCPLLLEALKSGTLYSQISTIPRNAIKRFWLSLMYGAQGNVLKASLIHDDDIRELACELFQSGDKDKMKSAQALIDQQAKNNYSLMMQDPIVKEVRQAIKSFSGDTLDAFGKPINSDKEKQSSKLSLYCQSFEKLLLLPVYELAMNDDRFDVVLDQHDGLTLYVYDLKDRDDVFLECKRAVERVAGDHNIWTTLEVKNQNQG